MWIGERLEINIPNISWELLKKEPMRELFGVSGGTGFDEYGNESLYASCSLFSVVVFPGLLFQRDVELPEPTENAWVDKVYYPGWED